MYTDEYVSRQSSVADVMDVTVYCGPSKEVFQGRDLAILETGGAYIRIVTTTGTLYEFENCSFVIKKKYKE